VQVRASRKAAVVVDKEKLVATAKSAAQTGEGQFPLTGICAVYPWLPICYSLPPPAPAPAPPPAPVPTARPPPSLSDPSNAPLLTFYVYRVQSDETWPLTNKNAGNLAGMMWYLHNEIVWHEGGRHGTYFSHPVTRLSKYRIQMKATQPLYDLGMDFGVVNEFDSNQCSGPFACENLQSYGGTVGCETWQRGNPNNFPHQQWDGENHYPDATWYSFPVQGHNCPPGVAPTGAGDCTYTFQHMGDITIDELEGISNYAAFARDGGREYDPRTDNGVHLSFWAHIADSRFCQWRVDQAKRLFSERYPDQPDLPEPVCNFNKHTFYPNRHV